MAVAAHDDLNRRPAGPDAADSMAQYQRHLGPVRRLAGAQDDGDRLAGGCLIDVDRQEAAAVVVRIPQRQLLAAVDPVFGVVDVEQEAPRRRGKAVAKQINHCRHHALERDRAGQVLQPADGWLRAQIGAALGQAANRHLERRIAPQRVAVVAVGIAAGDQQGAEADHLGERVAYGRRIAWVVDVSCQPFGDAEPPLDLGEQQHAGIGGQSAAVEGQPHRLAADRWQTAENRITVDHGGRALRCRVVTPARHQNHARFQRSVQRPPLRSAKQMNYPG
jgi:hypothetical protein